ncbi:Rec114p NDAI_0H02860 [Naumovozyma dairenensis CBS 421]|uniref:Uncharacterized protein n=1 Tax=Naumovozyma dairenensis (strain ATCC 10597 / BCRC 20456 / CBS 421 / NBRC 0211 / NRRL Y-12639) TaxID=1071378 RepID=G0WF99_NAUDC|nr:hypothetical protein NDAI_0H02860 [Naumovozyma dairenensis CBS 421]CCD26460.1 hypothetical protein NDAI_0H02860 [Naumovozyma dairenensis CBS 421]
MFSSPLKLYSKFEEPILAPLGFQTKQKPLPLDKWKHHSQTSPELPLTFQLLHFNPNINGISHSIVSFRVISGDPVGNFTILEEVCSPIAPLSSQIIQFSAKSPTLSCKYLSNETNGVVYLRRFQISLEKDVDFARICSILISMQFVMKNGRLSNTALDRSRMIGIANNPINYSNPNIEIRNHNKNDSFPQEIQTQNLLNSQMFPFSQLEMQPTQALDYSQSQFAFNTPALVNSNNMDVNHCNDVTTSKLFDNSNLEKESFEKLNLPTRNSFTQREEVYSKNGIASSGQNFSEQGNNNPDKNYISISEEIEKGKEEEEEKEDNNNISNLPTIEMLQKVKRKVGKIEKETSKKEHKSKYKISKKIIKEKLKDNNFLRWVDKVENVLIELAHSNH